MKAWFLIAALAAAPLAAEAQATLLPEQSEIAFTTRQMGVPVEGKFARFTAKVTLDPARPEAGNVSFTVDTGSARFGAPELDGEIGKPTWFNVPAFPVATFQSTAIKAAGPGRFEVAGKLTIKAASRDVVVPVQLAPVGANSVATGSFTIKRLDFKIGEGEWNDTSLLANDVAVKFKLALAGLPR